MRPTHAYDTFETTYSFPVDRDTVIETMGETRVESPSGKGETVATTLERSDLEEYGSARELTAAFMSCLAEEYIGRKFYDDRGDNPGPVEGHEWGA